jgi:predicted transcriptional regulator YheO
VDILDYLVSKTIEEYGKLPEQMSREDKIQVVGYLDDKGLFRIKGSVNWVAEKLGTSRYTIYNYLEAARAARAMDEKR